LQFNNAHTVHDYVSYEDESRVLYVDTDGNRAC